MYTFDPVPPTIQLLEDTVRKQKLTLIPKAVSDISGNVEIHMPGDNHARPAIHLTERESWESTGSVQTFPCEAVILDDYIEGNEVGHVDFVKIDVESAEHLVLKGSELLLNVQLPILFFEMWDSYLQDIGVTHWDFCEILRTAGYDRFIVVQYVLKHCTNIEVELPTMLEGGVQSRHEYKFSQI